MDVLLERLQDNGAGCCLGYECIGSLCSADGLAHLAPTLFGLRRMLRICEDFGIEFDIAFNWSKTVNHLGNLISYNLSGNDEITRI